MAMICHQGYFLTLMGHPLTALVKYDAACKALAAAKSVDEVKDIRDKATAMKAYARQAQNKQLEIDASEIRIRAERRLGEMLIEQKNTTGLGQGRRSDLVPKGNQVQKPVLADAGIDKKLSSRAQQYAAIPAKKFESILAERRERIEQENERVSVKLHTEAKKHKPKTPIEDDDDDDLEESLLGSSPEDYLSAFLLRADQAFKFSQDAKVIYPKISKKNVSEILSAAKAVVSAWNELVSNMEKSL